MDYNKFKRTLKKVWKFIWEDDSIWSWIANIILAFVLIKFIVYPGLGLLLGTDFPIVAVVSGSMEHNSGFDSWWESNKYFYSEYNMTKNDFMSYKFKNGFNKGDIMILKGINFAEIKKGEVIVFNGGRTDPIIHRVIKKWKNDKYYFQTKGDNNNGSIEGMETKIPEEYVFGKAVFRIPLLGYIKIFAVEVLNFFVEVIGG